MANEPRPGDGSTSAEPDRAEPVRHVALTNPPALRNGTELVASRPPPSGLTIGPMMFMMLVFIQAMLLVATAVSLTLIVARPDLVLQLTGVAGPQAPASGLWPSGENPSRLEQGPPSRLFLDLPRPIQVVAGQASNLGFRLLPPGEYRGTLVLTLRGLPDGSVLSGARKLGADTWSLDASRELTLSVTVPASIQGPFELEIGLRRPDGALIASEITSLIAVPEGRVSHDPERDQMAALLLLESARSFQSAGDVRSARVLLQSAAQRGNAQAAFELAQSFDPKDAGAAGDAPRAIYWYIEAKRLGHEEAEARLGPLMQGSPPKEAPAPQQ